MQLEHGEQWTVTLHEMAVKVRGQVYQSTVGSHETFRLYSKDMGGYKQQNGMIRFPSSKYNLGYRVKCGLMGGPKLMSCPIKVTKLVRGRTMVVLFWFQIQSQLQVNRVK